MRKKEPHSLKLMQELAHAQGGSCLSKKYINSHTKLKWQCKKGHVWEALPANIKNKKRWCPHCAGVARLTIEEMQQIAKTRRGRCLSNAYVNSRTKLQWECKKGHTWMATPNNIKRGKWCAHCASTKKLTLEDMKLLAQKKGGECLSNKYINARTKLEWKCKEGHVWWATPDGITQGAWCSICSTQLSERICREYFETIFSKKFPKTKPSWLVTEQGQLMELDGYCKSLNLAFEYQGIQHYEYVAFFHRSPAAFQNRLLYDQQKRDLCTQHNITLIEISHTVQYEDLEAYIRKKCKENHIEVPKFTKNISHELFNIYSRTKLEGMQQLAKKRKGLCLSPNYISSKEKLKWKCKEGHIWDATPGHIASGTWCPTCSGNTKLSLGEIKKIATARGGRCLSTTYTGIHRKLKWECAKGHGWEATPASVIRKTWCPYCAGTIKLTISEMQDLAKKRGGWCLSTKYVNNQTNLKWKCKHGHIWNASPGNIKAGKWCAKCMGVKKLTIAEMYKLAKNRDGLCLSKVYLGAFSKLKWKCDKGHIWMATPNHIKNLRRWCPHCAGVVRLTLGEMQNIAGTRKGFCLSEKYINSRTKLTWKCKSGHVWSATPSKIKQGQWCPACVGKKIRN